MCNHWVSMTPQTISPLNKLNLHHWERGRGKRARKGKEEGEAALLWQLNWFFWGLVAGIKHSVKPFKCP